MLLCPLLQYITYGYYIGDNFEKKFHKPDAFTCRLFIRDCSALVELFEEKMDNIKKGKLLCVKLVSAVIHALNHEDVETFCTQKILEIDWCEFFAVFRTLRREISDRENEYVTQYIEHIFNYDFRQNFYLSDFFDKIFCDISRGKIRINADQDLYVA